jgi:hypothetical protein
MRIEIGDSGTATKPALARFCLTATKYVVKDLGTKIRLGGLALQFHPSVATDAFTG